MERPDAEAPEPEHVHVHGCCEDRPGATHLVVRARDLPGLRRALAQRPDDGRGPRAILEAARVGWTEGLAVLLAAGADPNGLWRGYRPMHALIQEKIGEEGEGSLRERLACLDALLAAGADPDALGAFPPARAIVIAAFTGVGDFVERLRAGVRADDVFAAAALGDAKRVARLVAKDAKLAAARDDGGLTALACAAGSRVGRDDPKAARGLLACASKLLGAGADANARVRGFGDEVDVAYFAANAGNGPMLDLLLAHGADATAALPSTAWAGHADLSEIALRHGADPDAATHGDRPLLNDLVRWGQAQPAEWLLAHGASPNVADKHGWTALHQAASRGSVRLVTACLAAGADRKARDGKRRTALDVARERGRAKVVELLR